MERLEHEFVTGYYDEFSHLLIVRYHKKLSSEITGLVYAWIGRLITNHAETMIGARGSIYDFTEVKKFDLDNLVTVNQGSVSLNTKFDMRNHPVALVAQSKPQHEYLSLTVKITPDEERKKIVDTLEDALAFIEEFHAKHTLPPTTPPAPPQSTAQPDSSQSLKVDGIPETHEV